MYPSSNSTLMGVNSSSTFREVSTLDLAFYTRVCRELGGIFQAVIQPPLPPPRRADSVARWGEEREVKFQVFEEWVFDHYLKVTNTCWTKLKTCNCHPSPLLVGYSLDCLSSLRLLRCVHGVNPRIHAYLECLPLPPPRHCHYFQRCR
jgi:hypothetical protein